MILGEDIEARVGARLDELGAADTQTLMQQFADACRQRLAAGDAEWREQFVFQAAGSGRRILMCACTPLPAEGEERGGYVLVFDDITVMLQAQREAAWGEVARRLAHEIKNPLTPIRLSAERMRLKLLPGHGRPKDAQILERSTETIVQQVEAMKEMVNAFSEYARAPRLEMATVDLNKVAQEVTDLYRAQGAIARVAPARRSRPPRSRRARRTRGRVRQLLHNLVTNAIEALEGHADGTITIATRRASARRRRGRGDHGGGQRARLPSRTHRPGVRPLCDHARPKVRDSDSRSCVRSSKNTAATLSPTTAPRAAPRSASTCH